jgi:hypothetical protein
METATFSRLNNVFFLIVLIAFYTSCTSPKNTSPSTSKDQQITEQDTSQDSETILQPCYLATIGKDSATLEINADNGIVTGKLNYMFAQKDSNFGDIKGKINNDTISVDYTFKSEGVISVREMNFIVKNNQLIEGVGEYVYRKSDNKMVFKNTKKIDYSGKSFKFMPIECNEFP